ncbi:hypothetical protein ACN38_g2989 [Penicillium nordicum]|uniref:Uncharacterized protein n=1 Tax=Penicillium nordicum TaxID=229535 RepID=A0A0M9WIE3_9EURO|nr:hypothetical protein ACN38_g2989 [Penicillium nordicum]
MLTSLNSYLLNQVTFNSPREGAPHRRRVPRTRCRPAAASSIKAFILYPSLSSSSSSSSSSLSITLHLNSSAIQHQSQETITEALPSV